MRDDVPEAPTGTDNTAVLRRHFEEVLNLGRLDVIDDIYSEQYVLDAPFTADGMAQSGSLTSGRQGLRQRVQLFRTAFPDIRFSVEEFLSDGDAVAARYTFRGTQLGPFGDIEASGRTITITGILVAHFEAGQIYEAFSEFDSGEMVRQLTAERA